MALTIEELERARMFGLVPQAPAQQPGVDPQVAQQLFDPMQMQQQMGQQQQEMMRIMAEKGVVGQGGIRESERNPGYGQTKNGIDWLKQNYNPQEPARWGAEREGRRNVQERKEQQQADRVVRSNQMKGGVVQDGDVSRFYTGDTAQMAKDILTGGGLPQANMSMMPIDPRYGGGMGMGAQSGTTITSPELSAGWGTPMPAQEAYGYDQVGPGIYGPQDQSNPSSIYANKARQQGAAEKVNRNLQGFYDQKGQADQINTVLDRPLPARETPSSRREDRRERPNERERIALPETAGSLFPAVPETSTGLTSTGRGLTTFEQARRDAELAQPPASQPVDFSWNNGLIGNAHLAGVKTAAQIPNVMSALARVLFGTN